MLLKIDQSEAELGMFIHKLEGSWFSHPFWKTKFVLTDPDQLELLRSSEIDAVIIDTARGKAPAVDEAPASRPAATAAPRTPARPRMQAGFAPPAAAASAGAPVAREFGKAQRTLDRAQKAVSDVFFQARFGTGLKVAAVTPVVDDIFLSIQSNQYAFSGLLRCKRDNEGAYRHAVAVCALMIALARQLRLSPQDIRDAGMAGLLMDIGVGQLPVDMAGVDGDFRALRPELQRQHVLLGHDVLQAAGGLPESIAFTCLRHHERIDGSGYPQGLQGIEIDLFSRMAAICDEFDAMVSGGFNTPALDPAEALARLDAMPGLDREVLHAFIESVGVYPIGSFVRLASGRIAMVVGQDPDALTQPTVLAFYSIPLGKRVKVELIHLSKCYGQDGIDGIATLDGVDLPSPDELREALLGKVAKA
jgi:HD-GYP domain-containing protein (c-di-GMP phosphodiesterase class II)